MVLIRLIPLDSIFVGNEEVINSLMQQGQTPKVYCVLMVLSLVLVKLLQVTLCVTLLTSWQTAQLTSYISILKLHLARLT